MTTANLHVVVCGGGLAGQMAAAALGAYACPTLTISWLSEGKDPDTDLFYGHLAPPDAYRFNLACRVAEPDLILHSQTALSFGTHYRHWGAQGLDWVQAFHQPLPVLEGVPFHHYLTQQGQGALEPYLVSALAARRGAFAHPPEERNHPLSRAEYGYHFEAADYGRRFERAALSAGVRRIEAAIAAVDATDGHIRAVHLSDGQSLTADVWIDASGPHAALLSHLVPETQGHRRLTAQQVRSDAPPAGGGATVVTGMPEGWQAQTPLRASVLTLSVTEADSTTPADASARTATLTVGQRRAAWAGNCVGIGQAACVAEPLTPAPMILLQRDIERLLALLPVTADLSVERREFNRQAEADYAHAGLFMRALFTAAPLDGSAYWQAATAEPEEARLRLKIEQFESRGLSVAFDLEPFSREDWLILHYGMGRRPARYDRTADRADPARVEAYLAAQRRDIDGVARALPPHHQYLDGLTGYLRQQQGQTA